MNENIAKSSLKKHIRRFAISLLAVAALIFCITTITTTASAATTTDTVTDTTTTTGQNPLDDSSVLNDLIGVDASKPLEVVLIVTILSLAPSILIMMTSFTRIIIVFSFLRNAMSTQSTPPNQILVGLALFLTIFIMSPVITEIKDVAYTPYSEGEMTTTEAVSEASVPLKRFMLKQTSNKDMRFFLELSGQEIDENADYMDELGLDIVIPAFITSEIKRAFTIGFMLFVPFLIIDIVVASTLMSMGMMMLPPAMISLPFKIMLFVLVDGWQLLIGSLVNGFN
ncbi:MAG: flagellar type III secretion system pore protein FliP [Clostridiales bacterium]|nr:flagellar type III secretion system pore protein FliP [Clostridiales bacterium]